MPAESAQSTLGAFPGTLGPSPVLCTASWTQASAGDGLSAQCACPGGAHLSLPAAHDHQDAIGAHDRSRRAASTTALGRMAAQLAEVVLDVAQRDLACTGIEHVQGDQLGGLHDAHGGDCRPAMAPMSSDTPSCVKTARLLTAAPGLVTCDATPKTLWRSCIEM